MNTAEMPSSPTGRPKTAMWLLLVMFFAPLLIAFALYYGIPGWRPIGSTHHGDLINPAQPLPQRAFNVREVGSSTVERKDLFDGKWNLVFIGEGACGDRCQRALIDMRQVRLALNDDVNRVQRIFIPLNACCDDAYLEAEHRGLLVAQPTSAEMEQLLAVIPQYEMQPPAQAGRVYIVDPLGNLMMSYAADAPSKGLLEDLKKLLKLSHIG